jgi:Mg-chelatase subunit ChlD
VERPFREFEEETKMRSDLTDITLVVDRSGSMQDVQADAEGGVNAFIENQANQPGEALLTLVQFDTEYEFLHNGVPIQDVPEYHLVPRGMTALLDAVGRAINETGERLAKMNEQDRPGLVVFVIMTDGLENSSVEFEKPQIKQMIQEQQDKYNWHFTFLGANQDAFAEANKMGMASSYAANYSPGKEFAAYAATASKVGRMRKQKMAGEKVANLFTDEERERMK